MQHADETERIWKELHERLLSYIRRRVSSDQDAEDILQEVFARIHANLHRLSDADSVTGYVFGMTRNAVIDHHRARAKAEGALAQLQQAAESGGKTLPYAEETDGTSPEPGTDLALCMESLVGELPERYSRAIALTELGGLTQKEAAHQLGLSVPGAKARVQRGRRMLRELLVGCCHVELDRRRGVVDYEPRNQGGCDPCGCGEVEP